jgi:hypothetical protein
MGKSAVKNVPFFGGEAVVGKDKHPMYNRGQYEKFGDPYNFRAARKR